MNEKLIENSFRDLFIKTLLLASKDTGLELVELIVHSRYAVQLGGINSFDNIIWFNKERVEESINDAIMLKALGTTAAKLPEVFKLHKTLFAAKLKSTYKAELFVKAFAPKTAKAPAKKPAAKTAKAAKPAKAVKTTKTSKPAKVAKTSKTTKK